MSWTLRYQVRYVVQLLIVLRTSTVCCYCSETTRHGHDQSPSRYSTTGTTATQVQYSYSYVPLSFSPTVFLFNLSIPSTFEIYCGIIETIELPTEDDTKNARSYKPSRRTARSTSNVHIFCFVGTCGGSCCLMRVHLAPNPIFMEFAWNGIISVRKNWLMVPFRAQGRCLTQIRHVKGRNSV